jgi:hypothetical protein
MRSIGELYSKPLAWLWLLGLVLLETLISLNISSMADTARDVYYAWQISTGANFPTQGPVLAGSLHLGPVWYYVLSLPLLVTPSWLAVGLWVGFLSALKYPLAYAVGSRLTNARFGMVLAGLLALPGWTAINYLIFAHTSVVQTAALAAIYCLLRARDGFRASWLFALGLSLSLAVHAHPSAWSVVVLSLTILAFDLAKRRLGLAGLALVVLAGAAPVLPYLLGQAEMGWPDLNSSRSFVESTAPLDNVASAYRILTGTLVSGPQVAYQYVLSEATFLPLAIARVLAGLQIGLLAAGLMFAATRILPGSTRERTLVLFGSLGLVTVLVAIIRNVTPFYMSFVIYPFVFACVAWGIERLRPRLRTAVLIALLVLAPLSLFTFQRATAEMGHSGVVRVSTMMGNIRSGAYHGNRPEIYFPASGREGLAKLVCTAPDVVTLHGDVAVFVDRSFGLEYRMRCDGKTAHLGGQRPGTHWLGITNGTARAAGLASEQTIGSIALFTPSAVLHPTAPTEVSSGEQHPPRSYIAGTAKTKTLQFTADAADYLSVTNLFDFWMSYEVEVEANGEQQKALATNRAGAIYRCSECPAGLTEWQVKINAGDPERVEVVTFETWRDLGSE